MKKNLVLTGMMGVGKSTIGIGLSKVLNMKFIDIDSEIESQESMKIKKIFKTKSEEYFRNIEEKICLDYLKKSNYVIALGGGAFINKKIRDIVLKTSLSFWLNLKKESLLKRLQHSKKRPILNNVNLEEKLTSIYKERKDIYTLANHKIECDKIEKSLIINKIAKIYENDTDKRKK